MVVSHNRIRIEIRFQFISTGKWLSSRKSESFQVSRDNVWSNVDTSYYIQRDCLRSLRSLIQCFGRFAPSARFWGWESGESGVLTFYGSLESLTIWTQPFCYQQQNGWTHVITHVKHRTPLLSAGHDTGLVPERGYMY